MWFCKNFHTQLTFTEDKIVPCCGIFTQAPFVTNYLHTPTETIDFYLSQRNKLLENPNPPKQCIGCPQLIVGDKIENYKQTIDYINLSFYPSVCQCKCIYCCYANDNQLNNYQAASETLYAQYISEIIPYLQKKGNIFDKTVWFQVSPGEITIHPHKELIYNTIKNYNNLFFTNGFVFDEQIAEILSNSISLVQCDIDAGTRETYKKVKGLDMFEQVLDNLSKYIEYSHRLILKYMVLPNINDTDEDLEGIINIMRRLNRHTLWIAQNLNDNNMDAYSRSIALLLHILDKNQLNYRFVESFTPTEMDLIQSYYTRKLFDERIEKYLNANS